MYVKASQITGNLDAILDACFTAFSGWQQRKQRRTFYTL